MQELLSTFGINWKLLLAQGVNFSILLVVLWKFLYTPILRMIDERRVVIKQGVADAEAAAHKLSEAEGEGKEIVAKATVAAESLYEIARKRADEKGAAILSEAEARAAAGIQEARLRAFAEAKEIRAASEKEIARAAVLAAEKILKKA